MAYDTDVNAPEPAHTTFSGVFKVTEITKCSDGETCVTLAHQSDAGIPKERRFSASDHSPKSTFELSVDPSVEPKFQLNQKFSVTLVATP